MKSKFESKDTKTGVRIRPPKFVKSIFSYERLDAKIIKKPSIEIEGLPHCTRENPATKV